MTTVAQRNGAVGCICDSQVRDCVRIIEMGFPSIVPGSGRWIRWEGRE